MTYDLFFYPTAEQTHAVIKTSLAIEIETLALLNVA